MDAKQGYVMQNYFLLHLYHGDTNTKTILFLCLVTAHFHGSSAGDAANFLSQARGFSLLSFGMI